VRRLGEADPSTATGRRARAPAVRVGAIVALAAVVLVAGLVLPGLHSSPARSPRGAAAPLAGSTHGPAIAAPNGTLVTEIGANASAFEPPAAWSNNRTFSAIVQGGTGTETLDWNFGDGSTTLGHSTIPHAFSGDGEYLVVLTVTDTGGVSATSALPVFSLVPGATPILNPTASPQLGSAPLTVAFSDPGVLTSAGPGGPTNFLWSFGDGAVSTAIAPHHTYVTPGTYVARLAVTFPNGRNASFAMTVDVEGAGAPPTSVAVAAAAANVSCDQVGPAPFDGNFTADAFAPIVAGGLAPYRFAWAFGDGQVSLAPAPEHIYVNATSSVFLAQLTVVDGRGWTATSSVPAYVQAQRCPSPPALVVGPSPAGPVPVALSALVFTSLLVVGSFWVISLTRPDPPRTPRRAPSLRRALGALLRRRGLRRSRRGH
jgi:PKD repeat protein